MAVIRWHNGEDWVTLYDNEIASLNSLLNNIHKTPIDLPASEMIREDITTQVVDEHTIAESGSGSRRLTHPDRAQQIPETMLVADAVRMLVKSAHRHKVVANDDQPMKLCQCQCQCQCQCPANCYPAPCTFTAPPETPDQTPICTYHPDCDCNCQCDRNCNCSDGGYPG